MRVWIQKCNRLLDEPLGLGPRGLLLLAALLLLPTYVAPLWKMTMFAPQYPQGLRLDIYSYKLDGGNRGQDVKEINVLNHYIGMRDLETAAFTEFEWIPFVVGGLGLLFLRAVVFGKVGNVVDVGALFGYFSLFSLWSFAYKLWSYGHALSPEAAVKVAPFMPPLVGYRKIANFEVYSYPAAGSYALGMVAILLLGAFVFAWRERRVARG